MSALPSLIYRFNATLIKISARDFAQINKLRPKFTWRSKRSRIANSILKKDKVQGLTLLNFKTYYKATIIKIV